MSIKRQTVYTVASLRARLSQQDVDLLQQNSHLFRIVLCWLADRSAQLQTQEDKVGSFKNDCPAHLHVRAMKGARIDCDDIRGELEGVVTIKHGE